MKFEEFEELIDLMRSHSIKLGRLNDEFGIDLVETFNDHHVLVDRLWDLLLDERGMEWLSWFLYEKNALRGEPRNDIKAFDGDKEICRDLRGLYDYLVENRYLKTKNK